MFDLAFKAKLVKIGSSKMITVPKPFADMLDEDKKYVYVIKEEEKEVDVKNGTHSEAHLD